MDELALEDHVLFYGFVDESKKIDLYQKSWVFINPSIKEGWGLTVIEANACGTPAIAYDVEGLRDSIKDHHNGLLVEKMDYHLLSKKIVELVENQNLRMQLSQNAISWSEQFNWDASTTTFLSVLENIYKNK